MIPDLEEEGGGDGDGRGETQVAMVICMLTFRLLISSYLFLQLLEPPGI